MNAACKGNISARHSGHACQIFIIYDLEMSVGLIFLCSMAF